MSKRRANASCRSKSISSIKVCFLALIHFCLLVCQILSLQVLSDLGRCCHTVRWWYKKIRWVFLSSYIGWERHSPELISYALLLSMVYPHQYQKNFELSQHITQQKQKSIACFLEQFVSIFVEEIVVKRKRKALCRTNLFWWTVFDSFHTAYFPCFKFFFYCFKCFVGM